MLKSTNLAVQVKIEHIILNIQNISIFILTPAKASLGNTYNIVAILSNDEAYEIIYPYIRNI